jgi:hypothetical protein
VSTILNYLATEVAIANHTPNVSYNTSAVIFAYDNVAAPRLGKTTGYDWGSFGTSTFSGEGQIFPQGQYGIVNDMKVWTTEIDFGPTPTYDKSFIITDANVSTLNAVLPIQIGIAATGRQLDEDEMDKLQIVAEAGAGQFTLKIHSTTGPVSGKYKIGYQIGVL